MTINAFGGAEVFEQTELEEPKLLPAHVLIEVVASSVNPVDTKIRNGKLAGIAPDFPAVLHGDVSGVVAAVGEGVKRFKKGDKVMACAGGVKGLPGALADKMLVDEKLLAHAPDSLPLEHSAVLPLVGITAWTALIDKADIQAGQRVLIHGATGGVSHMAIQLARYHKAEVYVSCSNEQKAAIAKDLGARACFLYPQDNMDQFLREHTKGQGFDVVFDTVGGDNLLNCFKQAALNGKVVSVSTRCQQDLSLMHERGLTLYVVFMLIPLLHDIARQGHGEILQKLSTLVDSGDIKPLIASEQFSFDQVGKAHEYLESGRAVGKVLLRQ